MEVQKEFTEKLCLLVLFVTFILLWFHAKERKGNIEDTKTCNCPMRCHSKFIACQRCGTWTLFGPHLQMCQRSSPWWKKRAMQKQTLHNVYKVLLWCCLHCSAQLWYGIYQPNWSMLELRGTVLHTLYTWRMAAAGKEARGNMQFLQPWSWAWLSVITRSVVFYQAFARVVAIV